MSAKTFRWSARLLSLLILAFWGFFLIAGLFGDAAQGGRPLVTDDFLILGALVTSLAGLAVAWKWEFAGAVLTLAAVAVCAAVNWRVLMFPGTLIPITACLFLIAARTARPLATP